MAIEPLALTRNLTDDELTIMDGTPTTALFVVVRLSGDFKYEPGLSKVEAIIDRDTTIVDMREGPPALGKVSFKCTFTEFISGGGTCITPWEAIHGVGAAAAWKTTLAGVSARKLVLKIKDRVSPLKGEKITLTAFHCESSPFAEGKPANSLDFSGQDLAAMATIAKYDDTPSS